MLSSLDLKIIGMTKQVDKVNQSFPYLQYFLLFRRASSPEAPIFGYPLDTPLHNFQERNGATYKERNAVFDMTRPKEVMLCMIGMNKGLVYYTSQ
jgi:hypothetical protein